MRRTSLVPVLLLVLPLALAAAGARADEIPITALFDPALLPKLSGLEWSPDGRLLVGFWKDRTKSPEDPRDRGTLVAFDGATGRQIWTLDPKTLREEGAAPAPEPPAAAAGSTAASATRAGERNSSVPPPPASPAFPSLETFVFRPQSHDLLLEAGGDLFLWTPGAATARRLTKTDAEEDDPRFSPGGSRLAFVREHDLWTLDLGTGAETRLTADGKADEILNGENDWVYTEEIWDRRPEGYWWAPDGRTLAYFRFDDRAVPTYPLLDERPVATKVTWQRYPRAGDPNPTVEIRLVDAAGGGTRTLATGDPAEWYLARVHWRADSRVIAVERVNRAQNRLELVFCEPESGTCRTVATQTAKTWVDVTNDFRFLADGGFLWSDEDSGWATLARYDSLGRRREILLPDPWVLDAVADLSEPTDEVVVSAWRRDRPLGATRRAVLALPLAGGAPRVLADRAGWNGAEVAPATGCWIQSWSDTAHPTVRTLRDAHGAELGVLPGGVEVPAALAALPAWRLVEVPGPGGVALPARVLEPAGAEPGRRSPVIVYHYGGPASQVVVDRWERPGGMWARWMATRGYGGFSIDNEASVAFGKHGAERIYRHLGELELAGQLAGVAYLKTLPWADATRLGLWGWSGGGYNTLYAILHRPGVWRAAVAGAPVTDWRLYDSIWTERYMGMPEDNPDGYRDSSPINAADRLADALLLVHGTGDDNVHPQNSIALMARLIDAGRPFEDALYPNQKHGFRPPAERHFLRRMTAFFDRELLGVSSPPQP